MDLAASAGFVAERPERDVTSRPPVPASASLFDGRQLVDLFVKAAFLFAAVTGVYLWARAAMPQAAMTLAFSAWVVGHVALAFVSRSQRASLVAVGPFSNRVIDLWALAAIALLVVGVYVPGVRAGLHLALVPPATLAIVSVVVVCWLGVVEVWEAIWRPDR